ncbi:hypothetical protein ACUXVY_22890, partial [Chromobacterium haemolyticum]|uniref:hypothetical protein n=1 Tax=Chromobacterium haemolyticum TaxID=394935 RepID=UPI00405706D3
MTELEKQLLEALEQLVRTIKLQRPYGATLKKAEAAIAAAEATQPMKTRKPNAGHPVLQKLIDSIELVDGIACWDYEFMYDVRDALNAATSTKSSPNYPAVPEGWALVKSPITEDMHRAAVKVLVRANGVDGLPQRMLDAMVATAPPVTVKDSLIVQ